MDKVFNFQLGMIVDYVNKECRCSVMQNGKVVGKAWTDGMTYVFTGLDEFKCFELYYIRDRITKSLQFNVPSNALEANVSDKLHAKIMLRR